MLILGIESSCDETAAAVVRDGREVLSSVVHSQIASHQPWGGVVPEIASREHVSKFPEVVVAAMTQAGVAWKELTAIAVTHGPGLVSSLLIGLSGARALGQTLDKPVWGVNHLEGHALSPRLVEPDLRFPYLLLLVSGGHCQLIAVEGVEPAQTST